MIATLTGQVTEKIADVVVLDVGGIGYGLLMPVDDAGRLAVGEIVKLYVYEHIREQAHDLFGFCSLATKQLFEQLIEVNGVGPRMALNVLSIGSEQAVRAALAGGDVKFIQQANGVGKRVAERLVVELKDKVGLNGVDLGAVGLLHSERPVAQDEAVEALLALGYSLQDAARALHAIDPLLSIEERVTLALKQS